MQNNPNHPDEMELPRFIAAIQRVQLNLIVIPRAVPATSDQPRYREDVLSLEPTNKEGIALFAMCDCLDEGLLNIP